MNDLIERHKALHCAEMDSEIYIAINCLPVVKAIPIEDIQRLYNATLAYRDRFNPYSDTWIAVNDQAIGVQSILDMWERKEE